MLDAALALLAEGRSVFPVRVTPAGNRFRKEPLVKKRPMEQRFTPEELRALWPPEANGIGMECGKVSGLMRLDAEGPVPWDTIGEPPDSGCFQSPTGGYGWLMEYMDGATTCRLWRGEGEHQELRLQSDGSYTVVPPSVGYAFIGDPKPAKYPRWLYDFYVERALQELTAQVNPAVRRTTDPAELLDALSHIPADDYDEWLKVGMILKLQGEGLLPVWQEWSARSNKHKPGECEYKWATFRAERLGRCADIGTLFHLARQAGWRPTRSPFEPITDLGFANTIARMSAGKLLHSSEWGWLAYIDGRWVPGGDAYKVAQRQHTAALKLRLDAAQKSLARHAASDATKEDYVKVQKRKLRTVALIRGHENGNHDAKAISKAAALPSMSVDYRCFDQQPWLFNCSNGTLDLRTLELTLHDPDQLLTQLCPTPWIADAECPLFLQFLVDVLPDKAVRDFLLMYLASALSGDTSAQIMPILWGSGANGKSTLIQTVFHVLGAYYTMKARRDLLIASRNAQHPTSIARLRGKRFVACVESDEFGRVDEPLLKELTGEDSIAARRMREDEWEFTPTHKLVLATNHKPEIRGTDDGIWRRLPLVPFTKKFEGAKCNPLLKEELKAEASGILRLLAEACKAWYEGGLRFVVPEPVREATAVYRSEQDHIREFLTECCELVAEERTRDSKFQDAYTMWCQRRGKNAKSSRLLNESLVRFHITKASQSKYYYGVRLLTPQEQDEAAAKEPKPEAVRPLGDTSDTTV